MTVQLGFVGCGDVAFRTYFPGIAPLLANEAIRVAVCFDTVRERAERAAARFPGARAVTSLDEVLHQPGLDAAVNLTPPPFHFSITTALLEAGLHVYTEKPMAGSVDEAKTLMATAHAQGKRLLCAPAIMMTNRFQWLKGEVAAGKIGRPVLAAGQIAGMGPAAWRTYTGDPAVFYKPGVGPFIDTGVYLLHAITGLLGPAKRVQAFGGIAIPRRKVLVEHLFGQEIDVTTNDQMLVHLDFGDNVFARVLSSFATPRSRSPIFELHGDGGSVSIGGDVWYDANGPVDLLQRDESPNGKEDWQRVGPPVPSPYGDIVSAGLPHFVDVLNGTADPVLTAEHACHVLEIILRATDAAATGETITLETEF